MFHCTAPAASSSGTFTLHGAPIRGDHYQNMNSMQVQQQRTARCLNSPASISQRICLRAASTTMQIQYSRQPQFIQLPARHIPLLQTRRQHLVCSQAASGSNPGSSSKPSSSGNWMAWFDRLPPQVQLGIMGFILFAGMFIIPFLQPTFLYGERSAATSQHQITDVREASQPAEATKYTLPCYVPGASELYDFLQENSMPRTLPDGRTESPGVFRIYISSLTILALFYACSAVVSIILRGVAGVLRAVGVMGPPAPPKPDDEQ